MRNRHMYNSTHAHKHTHRHSTDLTQIVPHGPHALTPASYRHHRSAAACLTSATSMQQSTSGTFNLWLAPDCTSVVRRPQPVAGSLPRTRRTVEEWPSQ